MAQFSKLEVLTAMEATGLIPVFYNSDFEVAVEIVNACIRGGAKIVEFTTESGDTIWVEAELPYYSSTRGTKIEEEEEVVKGGSLKKVEFVRIVDS